MKKYSGMTKAQRDGALRVLDDLDRILCSKWIQLLEADSDLADGLKLAEAEINGIRKQLKESE